MAHTAVIRVAGLRPGRYYAEREGEGVSTFEIASETETTRVELPMDKSSPSSFRLARD